MTKKEVVAESRYSVDELVAAAKVLKSTPDLVRTALKLDGRELYTRKEAEKIVATFGSRKIK